MKKIIIITLALFTNNIFSNYQWATDWSNGGNYWIGGWYIGNNDDFIGGHFVFGAENDNKRHSLLCVNKSGGWASLMTYYQAGWGTNWTNGGNGLISGWVISNNDIYIPLHKNNGTLNTTQLFVKKDGCAAMLSFNSTTWQTLYYNNCGGSIPNWVLGNNDDYISGNFDKSSDPSAKHELLCINPNGWSSMFSYGYNWNYHWTNAGNAYISGWHIGALDRYFAADVDGDDIHELVCINTSNGWAGIFKYTDGSWNTVWANGGNYYIGGWYISSQSRWGAFDFDSDNSEEIFCLNWQTGWCSIKNYNGQTNWPDLWTNNGSHYINGWNIQSSDYYCFGNYYYAQPNNRYFLPVNRSTGWATMMKLYDDMAGEDNINMNEIPKDFSLSQNYPNPFNPSTTISFGVPKDADVKIIVYDMLGKEVGTLVNEFKKAGLYEYSFDASNLASGTYLYKMITNNFTDVKKLTLIK